MTVLDTNVVSELMRPAPDPRVLHWFSNQIAEGLHVTAVTMAEILHGMSSSRPADVAMYFVQAPKRCSGTYWRIMF